MIELDLLNELDERVKTLLQRLHQLENYREYLIKRLAEHELHFGEARARLREYEAFRMRIKGESKISWPASTA